MSFLDDFSDYKNTDITVTRTTSTYNNTTGKVVKTDTTVYDGTEIFWRGSPSEGQVADKIRSRVDATLIMATGDLQENDTVSTSDGSYKIIFPDNIGDAGDVYQYYLERLS